jgi:hypothetical protein
MPKIVVSLFDRFIPALEAANDLIDSGFERSDVSVIVLREVLRRSEGVTSVDPRSVLGEPRATRFSGVGDVAGAGPLVTGRQGEGDRSLMRALANAGLPEENAQYYAEGVRQGGVLVATRVDENQSDRAVEILSRHNPVDIDEHVRRWRKEGWNRFDETAQPLEYDQLNWPHNITAFSGERREREGDEQNWPATITEEPTYTEVREREADNWPQNITAREDEVPGEVEEEELLNWPHNITQRSDE